MPSSRPLSVFFFKTTTGNEPVREWLKALTIKEKKLIGEDIKTLQFRWPLGMPLVKPLGDGLYEIRTHLLNRIARTLFIPDGQAIILLHGFIKKTQKTPLTDLALAQKRQHEYLNSHA